MRLAKRSAPMTILAAMFVLSATDKLRLWLMCSIPLWEIALGAAFYLAAFLLMDHWIMGVNALLRSADSLLEVMQSFGFKRPPSGDDDTDRVGPR